MLGFEKGLNELKKRRDELKARHPSQPLPVIDDDQYDGRAIVTVDQFALENSWEMRHTWALAKEIRDIAQKARARGRRGNASWGYIIDDMAQQRPFLPMMIGFIPPKVVKALIRGDLPYHWATDAKFREEVAACEPKSTGGIYHLWIYRAEPKDGRSGFTINEMKKLIQGLKLYTDTKNPNSARYAKKVDLQYLSPKKDEQQMKWANGQRRFVSAKSHQTAIDAFINYLNRAHLVPFSKLSPAEQSRLEDFPIERCCCETGFSSNVENRLAQHQSLSASNVLYALVRSITRKEFEATFKVMSIQSVFFWEEDRTLTQMAEVAMTVLTSSYCESGGLNPADAGNTAVFRTNADARTIEFNLQRNRRHLSRFNYLEINNKLMKDKIAEILEFDRLIKIESIVDRERRFQERLQRIDREIEAQEVRAQVADLLICEKLLRLSLEDFRECYKS